MEPTLIEGTIAQHDFRAACILSYSNCLNQKPVLVVDLGVEYMGVSSMSDVLIGYEELKNRVAYRAFAHKCVERTRAGGRREADKVLEN